MYGYETRSLKKQKKIDDERAKFKVKCEYCGHTKAMVFTDRTICKCGRYLYKDERAKFKYKMKEELNKKT